MSKTFKEKIVKVIDLYCDWPAIWIQRNESRIRALAKRDGHETFLKVLKVCCDEGGIYTFFERYLIFRAHSKGWAIYTEKDIQRTSVNRGRKGIGTRNGV